MSDDGPFDPGPFDTQRVRQQLDEILHRLDELLRTLPPGHHDDIVRSIRDTGSDRDRRLPVKAAAALLDMSQGWVRTKIRLGQLRARKASDGRWRVSGVDTLRLYDELYPQGRD